MPRTVTKTATARQAKSGRLGHSTDAGKIRYVAEMVTRQSKGSPTRIRKGKPPHLYVEEHMEAKGLDASQMAGRLDIERESVYRALREPTRIWENIHAWAHALGLEHWQDLTRPPGEPSVDARLGEIPKELRDAVFRLVGRAS